MAVFIAEHNLAFSVMDHFSDLIPQLCPDSKIAQSFKAKCTKTKSIVTNALAPHLHGNLVEKLKKVKFSLIIDEGTDVSCSKDLGIVVRFYDEVSRAVKSPLYKLVEISKSDSETLFQCIMTELDREAIPTSNIIGFSADTCNVMMGEHNSVQQRMKTILPNIFIMRCICHTAHICASYASQKLPRTVEELMRDIYSYFSHSSKRQVALKQFQHFAEVEPHKILRPCQTRWLSIHICVARILEQWDALTDYFKNAVEHDHLLVSQRIYGLIQNPIWKLYFYFLDFVLAKFTQLNLLFQSTKSLIPQLHTELNVVYKDILSCFMKEAYWKHSPVGSVDPTSQTNMLPLAKMYMGTKVALCLSMDAYLKKAPDVQYFLQRVHEYYIEAALQIKHRFPIDDPLLSMLQCLDPNNSHFDTFPSLSPLATRFPNIIPPGQIQELDNEWRLLSFVYLPFNKGSMSPEEFWGRLQCIVDGRNENKFKILSTFMQELLSLPHANADVERVFSAIKLIKTNARNRLHTKTIQALLKVKEGVKNSGNCVTYSPPKAVIERMTAAILYSDSGEDDESDNL